MSDPHRLSMALQVALHNFTNHYLQAVDQCRVGHVPPLSPDASSEEVDYQRLLMESKELKTRHMFLKGNIALVERVGTFYERLTEIGPDKDSAQAFIAQEVPAIVQKAEELYQLLQGAGPVYGMPLSPINRTLLEGDLERLRNTANAVVGTKMFVSLKSGSNLSLN